VPAALERKHVDAIECCNHVSKMARVVKVVVKVRICNIYLPYVRQRKCLCKITGRNLRQNYCNNVAKCGRKFTAVRLCLLWYLILGT
jgi:hypothetical protein